MILRPHRASWKVSLLDRGWESNPQPLRLDLVAQLVEQTKGCWSILTTARVANLGILYAKILGLFKVNGLFY